MITKVCTYISLYIAEMNWCLSLIHMYATVFMKGSTSYIYIYAYIYTYKLDERTHFFNVD